MKLNILSRLVIPLMLTVCLFILVNYLFLFPTFKENVVKDKKIMLKELTNLAFSVIDNVNQEGKANLSEVEIKALAAEKISALRYGENGRSYFWIANLSQRMVMHPYRNDLVGSVLTDYEDENGVQFFNSALNKITHHGEGYVEYIWQGYDDDDDDRQFPKITFVKLYEPWGWIIGTGINVNDVEEELASFRKAEFKSAFILLGFLILILIFVGVQGFVLERKRKVAQEKLMLSEAKFKSIFQYSNDIITVSELDGTIIDVNEKALTTYGFDYSEVIGKKTFDLIPQKYHELVINRIKRLENESLEPIEVELITKEKIFKVEVRTNSFYYQGKKALLSIMRDITARKMGEKQLLNAIILGEEKERTRIAKELHDGLGPYLSTIKFYFQWLAESSDSEKKKIIIDKGNKSMQEAITILREVSNNLNPHILTNYGLMDAISAFIDKFKEYEFLEIKFTPLDEKFNSHHTEVALYRIIIELMNNTMKHANANKISITFNKISDNALELTYEDNGKGFDYLALENKTKGIGLLNIENRINTLDGEFSVITAPGQGFKSIVKLNLA